MKIFTEQPLILFYGCFVGAAAAYAQIGDISSALGFFLLALSLACYVYRKEVQV